MTLLFKNFIASASLRGEETQDPRMRKGAQTSGKRNTGFLFGASSYPARARDSWACLFYSHVWDS